MSGVFDDLSSILGDLDVASAEVTSGNKPAGPQRAVVEKDELVRGSKNDPNYIALVITYRIEGQPFPETEYLSIPQINGVPAKPSQFPTEPKDKNGNTPQDYAAWSLGKIKQRLIALGVPEDRINHVQSGQLTGLNCIVTLAYDKKNPEYTRIARVEAVSGATLPNVSGQAPSMPAISNVSMPSSPATSHSQVPTSPFG